MDPKKRSKRYFLLILAALALSILTFTPLVMPPGKYEPMFLHLPYTLWTGFLVAFLLVLLTLLSVRTHPGKEEDEP